MFFIAMSSLGGGDEICGRLKKMVCFLECCNSVGMSSQNINVWRPNPASLNLLEAIQNFVKLHFLRLLEIR